MNSSHERGQGKCAFADEFQTLIKHCSSALLGLSPEQGNIWPGLKAMFAHWLDDCMHASVCVMCVCLILFI